jgi:DNA-binding transcriptional ArsR family regulator
VGEEISGELAAVLDLSESTVSHHLSQLRKAGLVISDRRRMQVFHRVRPDALQALGAALDPTVALSCRWCFLLLIAPLAFRYSDISVPAMVMAHRERPASAG